MAGRQVRVYLHPDDRTDVESFIVGELNSTLLAPRWPTASPLRVASAEGQLAMICPSMLVGDLRPRYIESRDEWALSAGRDPVIEWWYSKLDGNLLYPGRLYYVPAVGESLLGANGEKLVDATAAKLMRWIKKFAKKCEVEWGHEYVSPRAAFQLAADELHLRRNPPGSRI